MSRQTNKPWQHSEQAWLTAQSLCLLKIRCDTIPKFTATSTQIQDHNHAQLLLTSVSARDDFGFTVGATSALMSCIVETTRLAREVFHDGLQSHEGAIKTLYQRLLLCSLHYSQGDQNLQLHHRIFQLGAIVYFHRSVLNSLPHTLVAFLDELLRHVKTYRDSGTGYVTLWPVFITAIEAYEERHLVGFQEWLDDCDKMGVANRKDVREVIENVWQKRLIIWQHKDANRELPIGSIIVDWREVMAESGLEVLLV